MAILNADDTLVSKMATRTTGRVVTVGTGSGAAYRAEDIHLDDQARASFTAVVPGADGQERRVPVRLAVHGEHQIGNACRRSPSPWNAVRRSSRPPRRSRRRVPSRRTAWRCRPDPTG